MANQDGEKRGRELFEADTDEAIVLPRPVPEVTADDEKRADADFEDQEIEIDVDELEAESDQPAGRKY